MAINFEGLSRLSNDMCARKVCVMLKESKAYLIKLIVQKVSRETLIKLLKETFEIEESGGQFVQSTVVGDTASKRKSIGGVFLTLMKRTVDKETVKKIMEAERKVSKQRKEVQRSFDKITLNKGETPMPQKKKGKESVGC